MLRYKARDTVDVTLKLQILRWAADPALSAWARTAIASVLYKREADRLDAEGEGRVSPEKWERWSEKLPRPR